MSNSRFNTPEYKLPKGDALFLATETDLYDYHHLYSFATWFKNRVDAFQIDETSPLYLWSENSDRLVFLIASCWLLRIPFIILPNSISEKELKHLTGRLKPGAVVESDLSPNTFAEFPALEVPPELLMIEPAGDPELFSSQAPELLAGYVLTSGSTGTPKIVPVKRRQILFAAHASEENFRPDPGRFWLLCLPLHHMGGLTVVLRSLLYHTGIYLMERFNPELSIQFLSENRLIQAASMVPTMLKRMIALGNLHVHREFKALLLGGGPISLTLIQQSETLGVPIVTSYGMTETAGQIAANPILSPKGAHISKTSVGRPFRPNRVEIRDVDGNPLPALEEGSIWLKGPQVFDGYLDSKINRKRFDNEGWFHTGDIGHINRLQHLFIHSRREDLIISGGENVNPTEVETELERLPEISEAVVLGVEDEEWGQQVIAFIKLTEESGDRDLIIDELAERLKSELPGYKVPKLFTPIDEFPLTDSGKINRNLLRELYRENSKQG